jgi:hypothetical protein
MPAPARPGPVSALTAGRLGWRQRGFRGAETECENLGFTLRLDAWVEGRNGWGGSRSSGRDRR